MVKQYNYCLDFIKGIACMFVVFMHCEFPGFMGIAVQAISRFCVPFFFMVSGYFCFRPLAKINDGQLPTIDSGMLRIKKKILHIGKITIYASLFYLAFVLLRQLILHNQNLTITKKDVVYWVVFNVPQVVAGQYWFLFALLYAYVFYGILERFHLRRFAYILAAVMFVVYIVMAQGMHLVGIKILNCYYRNWLIEAFPYFMLGHWIHENENETNISNKSLLLMIVVFTLLCLVERRLLGRDFGVNICTIPQVFALFVYGVKNPNRHEGAIQRLGLDCSMLVYILHPAVWHSLDKIYSFVGISNHVLALYLRPLLVLGLSIFFAWLFNMIVAFFKSNRMASVRT